MAADERVEYVSLAPLFGLNSMDAFLQAVSEGQRCMDCKRPREGFEGAVSFSGQLPHVELAGHLCEPCWQAREALRRLRAEEQSLHPPVLKRMDTAVIE
jgi:hypothetical protein